MIHLHDFLKRETRDWHARAEQGFARFDLTRRGGYGEFLQAQAAALFPLEISLSAAGAGALLEDWPTRRRSRALAADLAALGLSPIAPQSAPQFANSAQLLGGLYVTEGSKLGARFLLQRLLAANPAAAKATAFLSHGGEPAQKGQWASFLARLDAAPFDDTRAADALAGAVTVFALFERAALSFVKA